MGFGDVGLFPRVSIVGRIGDFGTRFRGDIVDVADVDVVVEEKEDLDDDDVISTSLLPS